MRIGVISDTHIPKSAKELPREVFEYFKGVEMILHAGDLTNLSLLDDLKEITPKVEAVLGNMDPPENQAVLPVKKIINAGGIKIGLIHGWGTPIGLRARVKNEFNNEKPDVIIFGHSHQPEKAIIDNVLYINPGSPTDKVFTSINSIAILNIENGKADAEVIRL